jgi:hypothetical protein
LTETSFGINTTTAGSGGFFVEIDIRESELKGEGLGDLFFGGQVHTDEYNADALAGPLVFCQGRREVVLSDEAGLNQALADLLSQQTPST